MKIILMLLSIIVCWVGFPATIIFIGYIIGWIQPSEMSGSWTDHGGNHHQPQRELDPRTIMIFITAIFSLVPAGICCLMLIDKIDSILN